MVRVRLITQLQRLLKVPVEIREIAGHIMLYNAIDYDLHEFGVDNV